MHPSIERFLDFVLEHPVRGWSTILVLALAVGVAACWLCTPRKPTYQDMVEITIVVQTGRTECHYVPAWKTVSCVTMPPVYGPAVAP
jgi:hypothetical protein